MPETVILLDRSTPGANQLRVSFVRKPDARGAYVRTSLIQLSPGDLQLLRRALAAAAA